MAQKRISLLDKISFKREHAVGAVLAITAFCVYRLFPTINHYWDGIGFAIAIENAKGIDVRLFNPNHLGYDSLGYAAFAVARFFLTDVRAHAILVAMSQALGSLSVFLMFIILGRYTQRLYVRASLTGIFAFSATWWKFASDADVYVPSVFCLIVGLYLLTRPGSKPNPISLGLAHAAAMLLHQIAVFFFLPAVVGLWVTEHLNVRERVKAVAVYAATAASAIAAAYVWVWMYVLQPAGMRGFVRWVVTNGSEEYVYRSVFQSTLTTLQSNVRLFFGGRFALAKTFTERPLLALLVTGIAASAVLLVVHGFRLAKNWKMQRPAMPARPPIINRRTVFFLSWIAAFVIFLCFWLIEWPYYRMFYLPAVICLSAITIERYSGPWMFKTRTMASFATLMALANFTFLIYPYSKPGATPHIELAQTAGNFWGPDAVVFYRTFNTDNWAFQYFNPKTDWRLMNMPAERFERLVCTFQSAGWQPWIDPTGLNYLREKRVLPDWLESAETDPTMGLFDRKEIRHFTRIDGPCGRQESTEIPEPEPPIEGS